MIDKIKQLNIFTQDDWTIDIYDCKENKYYKNISSESSKILLALLKQLEDDNSLHGYI